MTGNQAIVVWAIKRPEEKPVLNPQSGSFDFDDSFSSIADESKALHDDISDALNATNVQYAKITMYLEPNRDDRDYLYGRLLALADNFEESVLRKQGVKDRPTNAIKLMSNFTAKPYTTWGTLWKQLTPYLKSANGGSWFRNEVDDVMALFKEGDFEDNKALSPMFLLGYSCQRRASRRKAQEISQKNNSNN